MQAPLSNLHTLAIFAQTTAGSLSPARQERGISEVSVTSHWKA
jgi:hypothetical protein